ncbi:MAG TPA: 8-amino-7-oxononanoate synthase [Steroidobacteraceae bacterium]|nr:8-amino-7-oxononanoate synthase [Steroidobacteraceae bacterium]
MRRTPHAAAEALQALEQQQQRRLRRTVAGYAQTASIAQPLVDGAALLNFCSNDYLGLARHPKLLEAMQLSLARYGAGSGAAHLVTGHTAEHHALEEELAAFTGRESALLFSTGYMANVGAISALAERGDLVVQDRLNHASLLDGALLSGARLTRYAHGNADDAALKLGEATTERSLLIATDGVFSMDGDIAPLVELAALARARAAWLLVDDAHGLGALGARGGGTLELAGLDADAVPLLVGTLGKAFGCFGAFVAGERALIEVIMQRARSYIFTTALPPAVAAAARMSLRLADEEGWRRTRLQDNVLRFRRHAADRGIALTASLTAIQPVILGSAARCVAASDRLRAAGYWVAAIRPPTVPPGSERLRITLSAAHSDDEIDGLVEALAGALSAAPASPVSPASPTSQGTRA